MSTLKFLFHFKKPSREEFEQRMSQARRISRALIGASLWIYAGWDGSACYSGSLPNWAIVPIGFYLLAGAYLVIEAVESQP
jgi:hypothetical protein